MRPVFPQPGREYDARNESQFRAAVERALTAARPFEVTGSRASGAALESLLAGLVAAGVIIDNTTA